MIRWRWDHSPRFFWVSPAGALLALGWGWADTIPYAILTDSYLSFQWHSLMQIPRAQLLISQGYWIYYQTRNHWTDRQRREHIAVLIDPECTRYLYHIGHRL